MVGKEKEYIKKVKAAVNLQLDLKAQKKQKKIKKSLDLLDKLKRTDGQVTESDISRLDSMSTKELLEQIAYLRYTTAPNTRQKRKVGTHFQQFTDEELKRQITYVIKPNEKI